MSFGKDFDVFIGERCKHIGNPSDLKQNPLYKEAIERASKLFYKIGDILGADNRKLFFAYEDAENFLTSLIEENAYKAGLRDGAALLQELGLVGSTQSKPFNHMAHQEAAPTEVD